MQRSTATLTSLVPSHVLPVRSKRDELPVNLANCTIWTGDNPDILRGMNSDCVDRIWMDPPLNS